MGRMASTEPQCLYKGDVYLYFTFILHCDFFLKYFLSRSSVVVLVTRLRAGRSGVRILVETRDFSLLQNVHIGSGVRPASYFMGIVVLFRG